MSSEKCVALLRLGKGVWNKWREENPAEKPSFYYADLMKANLQGVDLQGMDLTNAKLSGADLSFALLQGAEMLGADLEGARVVGANLTNANLTGAMACGGVFKESNFQGAQFLGADLRGADLSGVIGLTHKQVKESITDSKTIFPEIAQETVLNGEVNKDTSHQGFFQKIKSILSKISGS